MGLHDLRDKLEDHKPVVIGAAGALILLCIAYLLLTMFTGGGGNTDTRSTVIYFDAAEQKVKLIEYDAGDPLPASPLDEEMTVPDADPHDDRR